MAVMSQIVVSYHHPIFSSANLRCRRRRSAVCFSNSLTSSTRTDKNALIQSLCEKGSLKQAIQLISAEGNPTQYSYELLIQICAKRRSVSDAVLVHRALVDNGVHRDPFLATKLIDMYAELGAVQYARKVFDEIRQRTIYVWNAIFRALSLWGHGEEVLNLYRRMNKIGMPPDSFTYTYALKACVSSEFDRCLLRFGKEIHARVLRDGYEGDVHVMTTLVDMYAKFGCVEDAELAFSLMQAKNIVSWSAMIACFAKNGKPFEALELFRDMVIESDEILPNSVTMVSVLQSCAALSALEQGKLIHGYVLRRNLHSFLPVMSALVTLYARCGELETSRAVFDRIDNKDVVTWNSMISGYGVHGLGSGAVSLFEEMLQHGISPSPVSFIAVLGACSHSGLVEEGKKLFDSMKKVHGIIPTDEHYACLVDLFGRANRLDEAAGVISEMDHEPGAQVWGSLLGSCRLHSNVKLAETASQKLFELEPKNAGNYVVLADIYADLKMWDDVNRVKKALESKGLEKISGCSWIEVGRKIYALKSTDELNPQIEQIHALLVKLSREMMEKGYVPETKAVLYDLDTREKERIVLGHSEKLAVAFGLINCGKGETIRITKNLRLCEDCHLFTKFISRFANREILVRDVNRHHRFKDGECSCMDYW